MLKLIGIGIKADTNIARKIVDGIAIIGIGILIVVGMVTAINHIKQEGFPLIGNEAKIEMPMKLMAVCGEMPAQIVKCTWIPFEEKFRTESEQTLFDNYGQAK